MSKWIVLLGRILFSSIFILKSFTHFSSGAINHAFQMGVPMAEVLVPIAGLLALLGGLSILLGFKGKSGAWLLVIFLIPTAFAMHQFWNMNDPFAAMMHHYCFWKNISLLGAALMITHFGTGPYSLDKR
jgi:putative oxidoreductase